MAKPERGKAQLRKGRVSVPGVPYLITTCTEGRKPLLVLPGVPDIIWDSLHWLDQQGRAEFFAAVAMPDHIHLLLSPRGKYSLSVIMHSFKGFTGRRINDLLRRRGTFWQEQYHDHAVRREESIEKVISYMRANPVRKGLCDSPDNWPHWRCKWPID